eukprot:scaffold248103_cov33-Prasinocladus_malaysianus.AAC.1
MASVHGVAGSGDEDASSDDGGDGDDAQRDEAGAPMSDEIAKGNATTVRKSGRKAMAKTTPTA